MHGGGEEAQRNADPPHEIIGTERVISPASQPDAQERADHFLSLANAGYQAVFRVNSEAQWTAVTDVTPEHDAAVEATAKAYAAFNGNAAIINEARELLTHQKELSEITVRQLTAALKRSRRADDKS